MGCSGQTYRASHTYAGKASEYDSHFHYRYRAYLWEQEQMVLRRIIAKHHPSGAVNCLDFACGTGRILEFLEKMTDRTTGVDVSAEMLSRARSKLFRTELIRGDLTTEPLLRNRQYNLITAFRFFLNAEKELREEAMRVLASLLTPDGVLVFNNHMNHSSAAGLLTRFNRRFRGSTNVTWRVDEMCAMVKDAGLNVADAYYIGVMPGWERHMLLPSGCYEAIDAAASKLSVLRRMAQDVIFVCMRP